MLSQQLAQSRVCQLFSSRTKWSTQLNSLLTALNHTATVVVWLVIWLTLSTSSEIEVYICLTLGISTSAAYPYTGALGTCRSATGTFKVVGYASINDCNNLANALVSRPVSVAVDGANFQLYKSGVFYNCGTNATLAALLVGMTDAFWVVKNSWGTTWGEAGYIRLARGNTCAVCQYASYPAVWLDHQTNHYLSYIKWLLCFLSQGCLFSFIFYQKIVFLFSNNKSFFI